MLCIITFLFKYSCLFNIACLCSIVIRCIYRHIIHSYSKCEDLIVDKILAWENSRNLAKLPIISFPSKWHLRNERRNSILMMCHYPAAWPIRSTTQTWVVTHHQYWISALVSQTSFGGETIVSIAKCWLFSQANKIPVVEILWIKVQQKIELDCFVSWRYTIDFPSLPKFNHVNVSAVHEIELHHVKDVSSTIQR